MFMKLKALLACVAVLVPCPKTVAQDSMMERHSATDRVMRLHHSTRAMAGTPMTQTSPAATASMMAAMQGRRVSRLPAGIERLGPAEGRFLCVRREVVALDLSARARADIKALGYDIVRDYDMDGLEIAFSVVRLPRRVKIKEALARLDAIDPEGTYAPNALFALASGSVSERLPSGSLVRAAPIGSATIGLVDTGVDVSVAGLENVQILQKKFGDVAVSPRPHGTRIASLSRTAGAGRLYVADVFSDRTGFASAEDIAGAIEWLTSEGVSVINLSLAGPSNILIERAVDSALSRGHIIVAAVGNEGPQASPRYPAAYPEVLGVTAVDASLEIYPRANRGPGVDVAARGVDVVANEPGGARRVSGTSYAAPFISTYLALRFPEPRPSSSSEAFAALSLDAVDRGTPGFDAVYGAGVVLTDGP
ncbi:MAG: S8 family serine peptidase [Pseudomonadota bacterium]